MYTQRIPTQCSSLFSSRVLPPSVSRSLVGRSSRSTAPQTLRPACRRSTLKTYAVLEKLEKKSGKRDLPTKGLDYRPKDSDSAVQTDILKKLAYVVGADAHAVSDRQAYQGVAFSVRERLIERFNKTQEHWRQKDPKFIYYLSAEFLMGRSLLNTVMNLGLEEEYGQAVKQLGYSLEELVDAEQNAALGNGGLGRLAACFLDSIATLDLPGWGYGIRYKYGMFRQGLDKGFQKEMPDIWLQNGNPWEIARPNISYRVGFYGTVDNFKWTPEEEVIAACYDNPIAQHSTKLEQLVEHIGVDRECGE